jgi:DNA-binding MarR family transcriptional regulator
VAGAEGGASAAQVESVMRAARALVGITAASIAEVDDVVTVPQLRVMVMISVRGPMNLSTVADGLNVSASNASRICDRLLRSGMIDRTEDPGDRRHVTLSLTDDGAALLERVNRHRRRAIRTALNTLSARERTQLTASLDEFSAAVGEPLAANDYALP